MHIVVVGFNHHRTPIEVREQVSFTGPALADAHNQLRQQTGIHEVTMLSTCNRTEIYTVSVCPLAGETAARTLLAKASEYLYVHRDREAIDHLFRVASGIDSLVLGETEILGQVRRAGELARDLHASGRILTTLFQHAAHAGKRARTETRIGHHVVSTASAAVALTRAQVGTLRDRGVMLVGTGAIAEQIAEALRHDGISRLIIASRSLSRATERAVEWSAMIPVTQAITWDRVGSALDRVDVLIAATTATEPVITAEILSNRTAPLVIVDLGVPRNVDAAAGSIPGIHYSDIDALNQVVETNAAERRREVAPVERIVSAEADAFQSWLRTLAVQPIITDLRSRAEKIRNQELEKTLRRMSHLSARDRQALEALTQAIVSKLLHQPTIRLKEHANDGHGYQFAEALRDLFNLEQTR